MYNAKQFAATYLSSFSGASECPPKSGPSAATSLLPKSLVCVVLFASTQIGSDRIASVLNFSPGLPFGHYERSVSTKMIYRAT